jgi:hypothetical protein
MVSYGIAEVASLQRGLPLRAKEPAVRGRPSLNWWRERFGFGSDCLTRSEARILFFIDIADRCTSLASRPSLTIDG